MTALLQLLVVSILLLFCLRKCVRARVRIIIKFLVVLHSFSRGQMATLTCHTLLCNKNPSFDKHTHTQRFARIAVLSCDKRGKNTAIHVCMYIHSKYNDTMLTYTYTYICIQPQTVMYLFTYIYVCVCVCSTYDGDVIYFAINLRYILKVYRQK